MQQQKKGWVSDCMSWPLATKHLTPKNRDTGNQNNVQDKDGLSSHSVVVG